MGGQGEEQDKMSVPGAGSLEPGVPKDQLFQTHVFWRLTDFPNLFFPPHLAMVASQLQTYYHCVKVQQLLQETFLSYHMYTKEKQHRIT